LQQLLVSRLPGVDERRYGTAIAAFSLSIGKSDWVSIQ